MKFKYFSKYFGIFVLGVLLIAVYKTFDNIVYIWSFLGKIFSALTPFLFGAGIAFLLYRPALKLESLFEKSKWALLQKGRRIFATVIILLITILIIVGVFALIIPVLIQSIRDLISHLPQIGIKMSAFLESLTAMGIELPDLSRTFSVSSVFSSMKLSDVGQYAQSVWSLGRGVFNVIMSVVISVYILLDRQHIKLSVSRLCRTFIKKESARQTFYKYTRRTFHYMNAYVYCKLMDALIIAVLSFIIVWPFGVPYPVLMALLLGLFNLIPYFGAIIACVLTALLTMVMVSPARGIWVLVALIVLQQIDANVIQPKLVNETMDIRPLWVIFSILLFGALFGFWGILLGVPVMALILSVIEDALRLREHKKEPKKDKNPS